MMGAMCSLNVTVCANAAAENRQNEAAKRNKMGVPSITRVYTTLTGWIRRFGVEKQNCGRVPAKRGCRTGFRDGPVQCSIDRARLVRAIDEDECAWNAQKERDGERESAPRNIVQTREGAIVDLLHAADIVELDRTDVERVIEMADWRIDEREMAVFADAHDDEARLGVVEQRGIAGAFRVGIGRLAIELMKRRDRYMIEQAIAQKAPEGCRMIGGHPGILVHVERGDARPIDFLFAQRGEKRVLRNGTRKNHSNAAVALDCGADDLRGQLRAVRASLVAIREDAHLETVAGVCGH